MSKKTDERTTPDSLFNKLNEEFNFKYDLAATDENHKLSLYYTKENSAFKYKWVDTNFLNCPYSEIWTWVNKANQSIGKTVMVLPCDTSTGWFHDFIWDESKQECRPNVSIRHYRGRFKFNKYSTSPKFATIVVIFN